MTNIDEQVTSIESNIGELRDLVGLLIVDQTKQLVRFSRLLRYVFIVVLIEIGLIIGGAFVLRNVQGNSSRITVAQEDIKTIQKKISTDALCPLYDIFLDSYAPTSSGAKDDPRAYEAAFVVLERGAVALGCSHVTRGKD